MLGVQLSAVNWGPVWTDVAKALTTNTDPVLAVGLCWFSVAAIGIMGLVALGYNLRGPAGSRSAPVRSRRVGA
jgi:hypothetical protein